MTVTQPPVAVAAAQDVITDHVQAVVDLARAGTSNDPEGLALLIEIIATRHRLNHLLAKTTKYIVGRDA